jgi:ankyrin repeat protein
VGKLIAAGADVDASPLGFYSETALQAAVKGGHAAIVERLIAANADVNAPPDLRGRTALQAAAWGRYKDIVDILLRAGAVK